MRIAFLSLAATAMIVLSLGYSRASQDKPTGSGRDNSSQTYQVKIDNFTFGPSTLTVPVGATVTWINQDDVPHTIVSSQGKALKSPVLDTDEKFSFTFTKAGNYPYYCSIHPRMVAKVVVQ